MPSQQGDVIYRFNPGYLTDDTAADTEFGFFSFALAWPTTLSVEEIQLWGPSNIGDEFAAADTLLATISRTAADPVVTTLRAGRDSAPPLTGPHPGPPTIGPGSEVVVAWDPTDADSLDLRAILQLRSPPGSPGYGDWVSQDVDVQGSTLSIPHELLTDAPGLWDGRVLVSDGLNTVQLDQMSLFEICNESNGGVEICDGVDNDCDGVLDNGAVPSAIEDAQMTRTAISWSAPAGAQKFDVVYGDVQEIFDAGGNLGTSVIGCVADDTESTNAPFSEVPPTGKAFWLSVRGNNCVGDGTYDTTSSSQVASRDSSIAASPDACP